MNQCFTKDPMKRPNVYDLLHHEFITGEKNNKVLKKLGITKEEYHEYLNLKTTKDIEENVVLQKQ